MVLASSQPSVYRGCVHVVWFPSLIEARRARRADVNGTERHKLSYRWILELGFIHKLNVHDSASICIEI